MVLKEIKIKFLNGLNLQEFKKDVFDIYELSNHFRFVESENPDFILFGPYGNDIPKKGNYIRIGYFCENIKPDMAICEWAFGVPLAKTVNNSRYKRIQWHGLAPDSLVKHHSDNDIDQIINQKNKFCNFLYSHKVPYREAFFKQLNSYKKVDAPGKSMNNMPSIDNLYSGTVWERKRNFLSSYKFTIAFENYSYPGYQTEKLYDAMLENSLPIYCGDPRIKDIFNPLSFVDATDYIKIYDSKLVCWLEEYSQMDFVDIRPQYYSNPLHRAKRIIKSTGRAIKMRLQYDNLNFSELIERIIEIDTNQDLYINYLKQPWFNNNDIPEHSSVRNRWIEIFKSPV